MLTVPEKTILEKSYQKLFHISLMTKLPHRPLILFALLNIGLFVSAAISSLLRLLCAFVFLSLFLSSSVFSILFFQQKVNQEGK